jgi:CBS domain containing-hemolysin-like protein
MGLSPAALVLVTAAIIMLSAFFVAAEFALLAAKRHRLEDAARQSRAARAALRNASELSVLLAGSQLGITVCTLALGAITKPAVHDWLMPLLETVGLPEVTADVIAFVLALFVVTFLHLVVGEMAPKSWAIAHPETSATLLALPMRGFLVLTRPLLVGLNSVANWLLQRVGVTPVNTVSAAQNADALRHLVRHSEDTGALDIAYSTRVAAALEMQSTPISTLVARDTPLIMVPPGAAVSDVRRATESSGHHRILVGTADRIIGTVHVRDTLTRPPDQAIQRLIRPVLVLPAQESIHEALAHMRRTSSHMAVVEDAGTVVGLVTLSDVLGGLVGVGGYLTDRP